MPDEPDREPARTSERRADRGAGARVRRDPRRGLRGPRRARPPLHREHDRDAPPAARAEPGGAAVLAPPAGVARRDRDAVAREDPREHGDRPQRAARPVGLDERSRTSTPPPGTGTRRRPRRRGSTRTTTCTTRSRTSAARTATSATRSCASTRTSAGIPCTCSSRSTTSRWRRSSNGASPCTTSTSRRSARARSRRREVKRELKGIFGKARSQVVKDYVAWPLMSGLATAALEVARGRRGRAARSGAQAFRSTVTANFTANAIRNVWSYAIIFCGHFPDQTYTFSRGGGRATSSAARGTCASSRARRTSRAVPCSM